MRVIYRHVAILMGAGIDAAVVHMAPGFRPQWFTADVPVICAEGRLPVTRGDWLVVPEDHPDFFRAIRPVSLPKVVFCQNQFFVFDAIEPTQSWRDFGITEAITVSRQAQAFIREVFAMDAIHIPNAIDPDVFRPARWSDQEFGVAYMPRKGGWNIRQLMGTIWHRAPELRSVRWIPINNLSETQVAETLRKCRVFVATGFREGLGMPPLEAMASGCLVVGYAAGGGLDYATSENGNWVPDEDTGALAAKLQSLLHDLAARPDDPRWEAMRNAGFATARDYSPLRQQQALLDFWRPRVG